MRRLAIFLAAVAVAAVVADGALAAERPVAVRVAFVQSNGNLAFVERILPRRSAAPAHALRELLEGPTAEERAAGLRTAFSPGAVLRSVHLDEESYVASFSAGLLAPATPRTMRTRFAQISATLADLDRASRLVVAVNGRLVDELPLERRAPWWRPAQVTPGGVVKPGSYPYSLRGVQLRLHDLGYLDLADVTGRLDYVTSQALLAFQGWNGIDRTGTVHEGVQLALAHSSRPRPTSRATGRRMEIHRDKGVLLLVDGSEVVRAVHTSTGAYGRTPSGTYRVYRKERLSWSRPFSVWMPYAAYFLGGIATHEYPDVPSYPASHGCVRLPAGEAIRVWTFVSVGTPVHVV